MIRMKRCVCGDCEIVRDYPYDTNAGRCPKTLECECGGEAVWTFQGPQNHIHTEKSSLYDPNRVDPRFGQPVASYQEKKALLKEKGIEETDVERFDDIQNDVAEKQARQAKIQRDPSMLVADSPDQLLQKISNDQESRGATGNVMVSDDMDSGMIDSWRGF